MLRNLPDNWYSFEGGIRWRCQSPGFLCEVGEPGNYPSLLDSPGIREKVRRIRSLYEGRLNLGRLDQSGTAIDILVANAITESYGTVPSPLDFKQLEQSLDAHPGLPLDIRLDQMLREIGASRSSKWLVRFEPGYTNPIGTPGKVSVGAHHMLLSTSSLLPSQRNLHLDKASLIRQQALQLASQSLYSAQMAVEYLNEKFGAHQGQLPLIAATYNAGSPRLSDSNRWKLVQYGEHIDRWIGYYNASRLAIGASPAVFLRKEKPEPAAQSKSSAAIALGSATMLSTHFSLTELTASETARKRGISNAPPQPITENLRQLAGLLESIRDLLGHPLRINSGYRSPDLNRAVGSKSNSKHQLGLAADFICPTYGSPLDICRAIAGSAIDFDQVIHEYGRWVHIGLSQPGQALRRQQLTIDNQGTHTGLLPV